MRAVLDIPKDWGRSFERIFHHQWRKILVLGQTDRGKSTFCRLLAQMLAGEGKGHDIAILDGDIGQKDIGPPATISLGIIPAGESLAALALAGLYFIGSVSPIGHFLPMVVGTRRLLDSTDAPFVIINTTGLIHGPGQALKQFQIESIQPDVIVAIERANELEEIIEPYAHIPLLRLHPSPKARPKNTTVRILNRERAFHAYFKHAKEIRLAEDQVLIQRAPPRDIPNRLCGLVDKTGNCLGLGIVMHRTRDFWRVYTPVSKSGIRAIQLGDLWINREGKTE